MSLRQSIRTAWYIAKGIAYGSWFIIRNRQLIDDMQEVAHDQFEERQAFFDDAEECRHCEVDDTGYRRTLSSVCAWHKDRYVQLASSESIDTVLREHGVAPSASDDTGGDAA